MAAEKPDSPSPRPPNDGSGGLVRQLANVLDLPFVLVGAVVIGAVGGYFVDRRFGTPPTFTLILGGVGFVAGIVELLRRLTGKRGGDGG
ncbi:MAG TPA: AtpZ/AtpI family protein [Candidatus Angelobacter sp.]|nr:AtpZ/AtpI family protein [Candidatus Angelobacter sp.]